MGDVDDAVGVRGRLLEPVEILEAAATHLRAGRGQGRCGLVRPGQTGDLVSGGDELGDDVRTGMAGPSGNENTHVTFLLTVGGVGVLLVPQNDWRHVAQEVVVRARSAENVDAEEEVGVLDGMGHEAHLQETRALQPVRHAQIAGVVRAQSEALDER